MTAPERSQPNVFGAWPVSAVSGDPLEVSLRMAIAADPGDLAAWIAYADWLQEHDDERGLVMARWLSPKVWSQKAAKEERDTKRWAKYNQRNG